MRTKKGFLVTAAFVAFALLIAGNMLIDSDMYALTQKECHNLHGGSSDCGTCTSYSQPCVDNVDNCFRVDGIPVTETWCNGQYPSEQVEDYISWGISNDPEEPTATTSDFGVCNYGYDCDWDPDDKTCSIDRIGPGSVEVDRGCTDKDGGHGTA